MLRRVALGGWLLALGCAPVAHLRPASGVAPGRSVEVGGGIATLGPRPYVEEETESTAQFWGTWEPERWFALSVITAFDDQAAAAGVAFRGNVLRTPRFAGGVELEAGYAWGALSLGAAASPLDGAWLYTAPRLGTLGARWNVGVPLGASVEVGAGFAVRAEVQLSWTELKYYNRRTHLAAALAYQW